MFTFVRDELQQPRQYEKYECPLGGMGSFSILDGDALLKLTRDEALALSSKWDATEKINSSVMDHNAKMWQSTVDSFQLLFTSYGLKTVCTSRSSSKRISFINSKEAQTVLNSIRSAAGYPSGWKPEKPHFHEVQWKTGHAEKEYVNHRSLAQLWDAGKARLERYEQLNKNELQLFVRSVELAKEWGWNAAIFASDKALIEAVHEEAVRLHVAALQGQEVGSAGCDTCSTYVVGDRRCECGNRRQNVIVEGDVAKGLYHYVEAY
jgi:hypothetical protein